MKIKPFTIEEYLANDEYITKVCNIHDELVGALKEIQPIMLFLGWPISVNPKQREAYNKLIAVLDKARGEQ